MLYVFDLLNDESMPLDEYLDRMFRQLDARNDELATDRELLLDDPDYQQQAVAS